MRRRAAAYRHRLTPVGDDRNPLAPGPPDVQRFRRLLCQDFATAVGQDRRVIDRRISLSVPGPRTIPLTEALWERAQKGRTRPRSSAAPAEATSFTGAGGARIAGRTG